MPNISPKGLFGRPDTGLGAPTAAIDVAATIAGSTVPHQGLEVWCSDATGVPQLVWALAAESPTGLTRAYAAGAVTVGWTPLSPLRSDSYEIRRPDGSLAGTAIQSATSFVDSAPRPLSGSYTVAGVLGGVADATPAVAPTLDLSLPARTVASTGWNGSGVPITWTHPVYGAPHNYALYRDGVLQTTISGALLAWTDSIPPRGGQPVYAVVPVLSGTNGSATGTVTVNVPPLDPINVTLAANGCNQLDLEYRYPGGTVTNYEIQTFVAATGPWTAHSFGTSGTALWSTTVAGYMRVRSVAPGGVSNWVQAGPATPTLVAPAPIAALRRVGSTAFQFDIASGGGSTTSMEYRYTVNAACAFSAWFGVTAGTWGGASDCAAIHIEVRSVGPCGGTTANLGPV